MHLFCQFASAPLQPQQQAKTQHANSKVMRLLSSGIMASTLAVALLFVHVCTAEIPKEEDNASTPGLLAFTVIDTKAHDPQLFTQGLVFDKGNLIESSGLYNKSFVRTYNAQTNKTVRQQKLPNHLFAEGITLFNDQLLLLSWRAGVLTALNPHTLTPLKTLQYEGEGWGITHDGYMLYTSDGSHILTVRTPKSFAIDRTLAVLDPATGQKLDRLNELEFAQDMIWANRWQTNVIYRINPLSGDVTGRVNLETLVPLEHKNSRQSVLNGIAYDPKQDAFWITGKNWPQRHLIKILAP